MVGRLLEGVLAPVAVIRAARKTAAWPRYRRLVGRQLIATLAIMIVVVPSLLSGLDLAAREKKTDYHVGNAHFVVIRSKTKLTVRTTTDDDDKASDKASADEEEEPVKVRGARFVAAHAPSLLAWWIAIVSIYGAWLIVEWIVGAISYMFVDEAADAFLAALHLPHDDPKEGWRPRLRINLRRQFRRLMRQVLAGIVIASGAPFFLVAAAMPAGIDRVLVTVVVGAWGVYWLVVTTAAKSDLAWLEPARLPWYLRFWKWLTTRIFGFRWWLPRAYGSLWHRITRNLHGGAELVEEVPFQMIGLSIARIVSNLPVIGLVLRPLIPVAATLVVVRAREAQAPRAAGQGKHAASGAA
jgi:hypothetical protein